MGKRKLKKGKEKQPNKEISWSVIPSNLEEIILSRLPVTSLMRFRCVCKHWCSLITDPYFIKMQLNRSTQMKEGSKLVFACEGNVYTVDVEAYVNQYIKENEIQRTHMVLPFIDQHRDKLLSVSGSCNGILLLSASDNLYLLNPATKKYKKLPYPEILANKPSSSLTHFLGFGHSPRTDEYKVIMIRCYGNEHSGLTYVCVYTLGTNSSWRTIRKAPYSVEQGINQWPHALVNGALHWMVVGKESIVPVSFDFGSEEFRMLSLPTSISKQDTVCPMGLVKFSDFLCLYHFNANGNLDFWFMKDYGDEQSWTKEVSVARPILLGGPPPRIPLGFLKGEILLVEAGRRFFILDQVQAELWVLTLPVAASGTEIYFESLVSLGNDGVGGNKQETRVKEGERSAEDAKANKLVKGNKSRGAD